MRKIAPVLLSLSLLTLLPLSSCTADSSSANGSLPGGGSSSVGDSIPTTIPLLEDTRPETEEMVTITTLNGKEVTYNKNTRRIVTLSSAGDVVSLGIRPYAIEGTAITDGYEDFFTDEISLLNYTQPFNAEEIMMYKPDVILVYDTMDESNIERLEKIAKQAVIPIYYDEYDYAKRLNYIASLFGLEENARTVSESTDSMVAEKKQELLDMGIQDKTLTIFSYYSNGICIPPTYRDGWTFNRILYTDLGMKKNEKVEEYLNDMSVSAYNPISQEKLREYEGDIVLFADITTGPTTEELEVPQVVQENVGWQSLQAVKEDRVGVFNASYFAMKDVLYLEKEYDLLIDALQVASAL